MQRGDSSGVNINDVFNMNVKRCSSHWAFFIIPPSLCTSKITHTVATHHTHRCTHNYPGVYVRAHAHTHTHIYETNESCPVSSALPLPTSFANEKFLRGASFCFWGMAAHSVFGGGGEEGLTEGVCVCVCVCGRSPDEAALARGSLSARGSSKPVPSSPARRDHLFH